MPLSTSHGIDPNQPNGYTVSPNIQAYTELKLQALGLITAVTDSDSFASVAQPLLASIRESRFLLKDHLSPIDGRIQAFINRYFKDIENRPSIEIPGLTFNLDQHGIARLLSLPRVGDSFVSPIISSYRIQQGVLHNPVNDRRTTAGVFHVAEGGLPIPDDKLAVPKITAAHILARALQPPRDLAQLPYLSKDKDSPAVWLSLMLRPIVRPAVPGFSAERRMEVRFFAPGSMACNLDFVESIFGNAGDPFLASNDAALDPESWTGTTGCVILAPHLVGMLKKDIGLPHSSEATELQRSHGMCWDDENERYNNGGAFKMTFRDQSGVIVTVIADNYFGYCKKEVKTQISFSANLMGTAEEEHAGGALVYSAYDLGEDFEFSHYFEAVDHTFDEAMANLGDSVTIHPEGYATDKRYSDILYVPEDVHISLVNQTVEWTKDGKSQKLRLIPNLSYVLPSGYKVEMVKPSAGRRWRLRGTVPVGHFCHKPCTVSGGGKSEISKPITDAILSGPVYVRDYASDFAQVREIVNHDYSDRFCDPTLNGTDKRPFLGNERSLGSVIKLLSRSPEFSDAHNAWIESIPQHIKDIAFVIKRFYREDWGTSWAERFSVDTVDNRQGNELRYKGSKMITQYLRVGYNPDGTWRTFSLRKDFLPATKISTEDDISATVVVPNHFIPGYEDGDRHPSAKVVVNCEHRFFQRPDDAIVRGYDKQTEKDMSAPGNFLSNYQPLTREDAIAQASDPIRFEQYTEPMQALIRRFAEGKNSTDYLCSPANPRLVDGVPTKNPRYLQIRPDILQTRTLYLADVGTRLSRKLPLGTPVINPVGSVLTGRRNNPPESNVRSLAVYNPIHYMELPELFMEYIASITGKSPSTTGAGSEGALTKGPFNALPPIHDLNAALRSFAATRYEGFITAAACVGPNYRVDHDVSLLIPELWSRMRPSERCAKTMIAEGYLEKLEDFQHDGRTVLASRLGYRITPRFVRIFFGRIFNNPSVVFPIEMLRPELQDRDTFIDGIDNIAEAHQWVAQRYLDDGSVNMACQPLKVLLHIMATGSWEGKDVNHPEVRALFEPENILASQEYQQCLLNQQQRDAAHYRNGIHYLEGFLKNGTLSPNVDSAALQARLHHLKSRLASIESPDYIQHLQGTTGCDFS